MDYKDTNSSDIGCFSQESKKYNMAITEDDFDFTFCNVYVKKICCIGANQIGAPFGIVVAYKCPEIHVKVVDKDEGNIWHWNSKNVPFCEDSLLKMLNKCRDSNLFFSTEVEAAIKEADIIFICSDLNPSLQDLEPGKGTELKPLRNAALLIAKAATSSKIIVDKSTIPLRAVETLSLILKNSADDNKQFVVLSNPNFFIQDSSANAILYPERVLIGGDKSRQANGAIEALISIYRHWVPLKNIIIADIWSSQLARLATNAFFAQRISSINALTEMCEITNADVSEVASAIGTDFRIGAKGLEPSIGFEDPLLHKDIISIIQLCESLNLPHVASYWQKVLDMNEYHVQRFTWKILNAFLNVLTDVVIAILGVAHRKDTDKSVNPSALHLCKRLIEEGAKLNVYDPVIRKSYFMDQLAKACGNTAIEDFNEVVTIFRDPYEAINKTRGIVICANWPEFKNLDYFKVYNDMMKPSYIFDGKRIVPHKELIEMGFNVFTVGKNLDKNFTPPVDKFIV